MKTAWLALAVAACSDAPCGDVDGTCVILRVTSPEVHEIDHLEVDVLAGAFHATTTTGGHATALPLETALELALPDDLDLGVVAAGERDGGVVGTGFARLTVANGEHTRASIVLLTPASCDDGKLFCGGNSLAGSSDTLYRCHSDGVPTARGVCPGDCLVRPAKGADECAGVGGTCIGTGFYCGGDKVDGDPQSLYRCNAGAGTFVTECADGCVLGSPGHDDACR